MLFFSVNVMATPLQNITSFEASFRQTISNASTKTIEYSGEVFIKANQKILWRYAKPVIKNVYVIKNIAIIDEPELEQVIYTQLQNDMNLIYLIKQAEQKSENLYVTALNEIEYHLHVKNETIQKITYKDELENSVEIVFDNIKQNMPISDELFKFFPPEHYDIIRQ